MLALSTIGSNVRRTNGFRDARRDLWRASSCARADLADEFDWVERLSADELQVLADGRLDIESYRQNENRSVN
jgi:hypothetical protein